MSTINFGVNSILHERESVRKEIPHELRNQILTIWSPCLPSSCRVSIPSPSVSAASLWARWSASNVLSWIESASFSMLKFFCCCSFSISVNVFKESWIYKFCDHKGLERMCNVRWKGEVEGSVGWQQHQRRERVENQWRLTRAVQLTIHIFFKFSRLMKLNAHHPRHNLNIFFYIDTSAVTTLHW